MSMTEIARTDIAVPAVERTAPADAMVPIVGAEADVHPHWSLPTRIGFRFTATYFFLYVMCTQMYNSLFGRLASYLPFTIVPPGFTQPVRTMKEQIAANWLKYPQPLSQNAGAGDKPIDYALVVGLLVIAAAITIIWSGVDWKRRSYPRLNAWVRLFLRFSLATSLATYGWMKAFPLQMPFPPLSRMLEPYGHFSLMAVLWSKIGSSTAYEIFTGCAELLAAVLLLIPGLSTIGALVAIPVTFQVWMLNMTYDVPVKLFSLHLLLMSSLLLLPDLRRLVSFFVLKRATDPPRDGRLFRGRTAHRVAIAVQVVFAIFLLWGGYQQGKAGAAARLNQPKPPLYGIWNIDRMLIDGVERAPLLTDHDRWRRLIVQVPGAIQFQRMNDSWAGFSATTDVAAKTMVLTTVTNPQVAASNPQAAERKEVGRFTLEQPSPERLILDGAINGRKYRLETSYFDPAKLRLVSATFHWVQDRPWNISNADYVSQQLR